MAGMMELNGCRIIVKEIAGGKMVLDTRIKSYDPIRKVVKVSAGSLDNRMEHAVTVIIFGPNGSLVEATGNLRCEFPYKSRVMGTSEPLKPLKAPYMARNPVKWGFFRLKGQEIPLKI